MKKEILLFLICIKRAASKDASPYMGKKRKKSNIGGKNKRLLGKNEKCAIEKKQNGKMCFFFI